MTDFSIALIGNPNSGKSSVFNRLTGARQHIGNWPGVTVERVSGELVLGCETIEVVDLPGTYALGQDSSKFSIDEQIAQQEIELGHGNLFVNVVDASNLERHLFLTSQLRDRGLNMIVVLNMIDVAKRRGVEINEQRLAQAIGCPVVSVSANNGAGFDSLCELIEQHVGDAAQQPSTPLDSVSAHYQRVDDWLDECRQLPDEATTVSEKIDNVVLNKFLAMPIFLAVIYAMFLFSVNIGSAFIDFFDGIAGIIFVESPRWLLTLIGAPDWLIAFIADGVGGGVQLVASFIPVIGAMFLILAWLEDCGYMARAAFVMDRIMRQVGLPGKAFVPLIIGFGCNVPAVMAARTLESERDRIAAVLMAPFMSCGARLTVYALFAAAFFPTGGHNIVFILYLTGIAIAILSALAMKKTLLKGESGHFVLELPNYHWPLARNILLRTWHRLSGFVVRAGKAIVLVVIVLNVLNSMGTDGSYGNENTEKSVLSAIGKTITPVFSPMGISENNWPATVGIFTGLFAKEVVVGTLDSLYSTAAPDDEEFEFVGAIGDAVLSVPENLAGLTEQLFDPLGLNILATESTEDAAATQEVDTSTFGAMQRAFDGKIGAFAYLLFVLLYAPCIATIGAIYRELNRGWSIFITLWSGLCGYGLAVFFYQAATFTRHPSSSAAWLVGVTAVFILTMWSLRRRAATLDTRRDELIIAKSSG